MGIDREGVFSFASGARIRLAGILWPDAQEPERRALLQATLETALDPQTHLFWRAQAAPDRWGILPAALFAKEADTNAAPFLVQEGLVAQGLAPLWPEGDAACHLRLQHAQRHALAMRRGYWAPRAQASRLARLAAAPETQIGRRIVAHWRFVRARTWRDLTFIHVAPGTRRAPSLMLAPKIAARLGVVNPGQEKTGQEKTGQEKISPNNFNQNKIDPATIRPEKPGQEKAERAKNTPPSPPIAKLDAPAEAPPVALSVAAASPVARTSWRKLAKTRAIVYVTLGARGLSVVRIDNPNQIEWLD